MDEKDESIIKILESNCKLSTQQISKKTLIPITTVHHRMKKLEKENIIMKYTILLNKKKMGKSLSAHVLITVDYHKLKKIRKSQHDLAEKIMSYENVEEASVVTGETDIIIRLSVRDIDELNNFVTKYLQKIEGIERTKTLVILSKV